jgi:hypothetical protein
MMKSARKAAPRVHVPLRRLALCLDCDECFEIGDDACPACGSATWTSLARFLEIGSSEALAHLLDGVVDDKAGTGRRQLTRRRARHLIIVARDRPALYEHLRRAFEGNETIQVILDRRVGERRERNASTDAERRRAPRRSRSPLDGQLSAIGWSVVLLDLGAAPDHH